jgi:predicted ATPase with chaperone activity
MAASLEESILARLTALRSAAGDGDSSEADQDTTFIPREPASFQKAGLADSESEALVLKFLLARGDATGREIADQVKLPFVLVDQLLRQMKLDQLLVHRGSAPMNDYQYQMSDLGRERARRHAQHCTYFGSAPVSLADYVASVKAQSLTNQHPTSDDLNEAFADLLINKEMLDRLGPAVNSGRGLFLYGAPGNGKTSIAERVTAAFGKYIWIPRAIGVDGEIIRVFDPMSHAEAPLEAGSGILEHRNIDKRWVRIRRPTIVAAGELTMSALEVTVNTSTGISEAPLQMKSNCGTLVIDDFGRQRMRIEELLNRWIVPLEKHCDYLGLPNGKKIQVPFDQLIVFSTNLEPKDLVDEAFLRRIPYKIEVSDPTEEEFRRLFTILSQKMGVEYRREPVDHLIEKHYKSLSRPFRYCHPRDLLLQISNFCAYRKQPLVLSNEAFDRACENYFAIMAP